MDSSEVKNAFHTLTLMRLISKIESTPIKNNLNSQEEAEMQENIKKLMELYEQGPKLVKKEIMKVLQDRKNHSNVKIQTLVFNSFNKFHEKYHHQIKTIQNATDDILKHNDNDVIKEKLDKIQETAEDSEFEDMPKTAKACFNYIARQHGIPEVREKAKTRAEKL